MKIFDKIAVVGTGLIGGSIALAIKKRRLGRVVIGVSRHKQSLILAKKIGAIDIGSQSLSIIRDADLVILATPVGAIVDSRRAVAKLIKPGCIVSDVGSTKNEIVHKLSALIPRFVGSHPMAGSEKRGIISAEAGLFKNSICIITPVKRTDSQALDKMKEFWLGLGARVVLMSPEKHDRILSFLSHLPHTVAFALINSVSCEYFKFSANSFKDTTRIAASDSEIWSDILLSNRINILRSIRIFEKEFLRIKSALLKKDKLALLRILKQAKVKRESLK